jgi:hypothetical protein
VAVAKSLAELIDEMNARLPSIRPHFNRGKLRKSRWDGHNCHLVVDCDCRELDNEDAPETLHAQTPDEA